MRELFDIGRCGFKKVVRLAALASVTALILASCGSAADTASGDGNVVQLEMEPRGAVTTNAPRAAGADDPTATELNVESTGAGLTMRKIAQPESEQRDGVEIEAGEPGSEVSPDEAFEPMPDVLELTIRQANDENEMVFRRIVDFSALEEPFSTHNVVDVSRTYPFSNVDQLKRVFTLICEGCDLDELTHDLGRTELFEHVRQLNLPRLLDLGSPGGVDPEDHMWQTHATDWMWNLVNSEADLAWRFTWGDPSLVVAISDIGFDTTHPDLAQKMSSTNPCQTQPLGIGSHGTAVSTIAGAHTQPPGIGTAGQMPSTGFNLGLIGLAAGTPLHGPHCASLNMDVAAINFSWFNSCSPDPTGNDQLAIQEMLNHGTALVGAAANGPVHCNGSPVFPINASYDQRVIVVTSHGQDNKHFQGANTHSHYPDVDLTAPGHGIMGGTSSGSPWPYYGGWGGTSFAAPQVTATIGLMRSVNPCLSVAEIQHILRNSTNYLEDAAMFPGEVGTGRLSVNRAVAVSLSPESGCPQNGPGRWTDWLDRDNGSGTGDWETIAESNPLNPFPMAVQCRTTSGTYFTQSVDSKVTCNRDQGLICRNADQVANAVCSDYEVRYYYPERFKARVRHEDTGRCLYGYPNVDGGNVHLWSCWDDPNMVFEIVDLGNNQVRLEHETTGKCPYGYPNIDGGNVHIWTCWSDPGMVFNVQHLGNGKFRLQHDMSKKCLYGFPNVNGAKAHIWSCWNDPNMTFSFEYVL